MADMQSTAYSVQLLSGRKRYDNSENYLRQETNKVYRLESDTFQEAMDAYQATGDTSQLAKVASVFINHHVTYVQPRILKLFRYYQGDNDIHYIQADKPDNRADNRIASGFPNFITTIRVGHTVGNPIKYRVNLDKKSDSANYEDVQSKVEAIIADFNKRNDINYHEKVMSKNLSICGRAYELEYPKEGSTEMKIRPLDPAETFVVYDTTIEMHSLFACRHYITEFDGKNKYWAELYTDDFVFYFESDGFNGAKLKFNEVQENKLSEMPITEFINNDERMGDWEAKMDDIDAVDKAKSAMANFQEDFENATLHISGDIRVPKDKEKNGITGMLAQMVDSLKKRVMFTKPAIITKGMGSPVVVEPKVEYITKKFDSQGWKVYLDGLINDIHKDTNTPNLSDQNFSGTQSGEALSYKLWGSDQERAIHESLYERGIMRRIRLLFQYLEPKEGHGIAEAAEQVVIVFTPNLPKNDQAIVDRAKALHDTGDISSKTFHELIQAVTGIGPDIEAQRMENERTDDTSDGDVATDPSILANIRSKLGLTNQQGTDDHDVTSKDDRDNPQPVDGEDNAQETK